MKKALSVGNIFFAFMAVAVTSSPAFAFQCRTAKSGVQILKGTWNEDHTEITNFTILEKRRASLLYRQSTSGPDVFNGKYPFQYRINYTWVTEPSGPPTFIQKLFGEVNQPDPFLGNVAERQFEIPQDGEFNYYKAHISVPADDLDKRQFKMNFWVWYTGHLDTSDDSVRAVIDDNLICTQ